VFDERKNPTAINELLPSNGRDSFNSVTREVQQKAPFSEATETQAQARFLSEGEKQPVYLTAKATFNALWARELKESIASSDNERVLRTLGSIPAEDLTPIRESFRTLYEQPLLEALQNQLGKSSHLDRALFLLQGQPIHADAQALKEILSDSSSVLPDTNDVLSIVARYPQNPEITKTYQDLSGRNLIKDIHSKLSPSDAQIVQATLDGNTEKAAALQLSSQLSKETPDIEAIVTLITTAPNTFDISTSLETHSHKTLDQHLQLIPKDSLRNEVSAICNQRWSEAHVLRLYRLMHTPQSLSSAEKFNREITEILILYSIRERSVLFKLYREKYDRSLHDDLLIYLEQHRINRSKVDDIFHETPLSDEQIILNVAEGKSNISLGLEVLQHYTIEELEKIDEKIQQKKSKTLHEIVAENLKGKARFEMELALQGASTTLEEEKILVNTRHRYERTGYNLPGAKLLDFYSPRGEILDKSVSRVEDYFSQQIEYQDFIKSDHESHFYALVHLVEADLKSYRTEKHNFSSKAARIASYFAFGSCFLVAESLDWYLDNLNQPVFVSIIVAALIAVITEWIVQPYLKSNFFYGEKLVKNSARERKNLRTSHSIKKELKKEQQSYAATFGPQQTQS
jgi:hypothetical protein